MNGDFRRQMPDGAVDLMAGRLGTALSNLDQQRGRDATLVSTS